MNVEIGTEVAQILFWVHINGIFVAVYITSQINHKIKMGHFSILLIFGLEWVGGQRERGKKEGVLGWVGGGGRGGEGVGGGGGREA
jgi:hypothetical protein